MTAVLLHPLWILMISLSLMIDNQRWLIEKYFRGFDVENVPAVKNEESHMGLFDKLKKKKVVEPPESGVFIAMVLLEDVAFDREKFFHDLDSDWGIRPDSTGENIEDVYSFMYDDMLVWVSLMRRPVPNDESVHLAETNYYWPEAAEVAKRHKAHLLVSVMGHHSPCWPEASTIVRVVSSCCKQKGVLGVDANGTVYQPEYYTECAALFDQDFLPIQNLVWVGLIPTKKGVHIYTNGMESFGKFDMEVMEWKGGLDEAVDFMYDIIIYVTDENITLHDGETIGRTADQKFPITLSPSSLEKGKMTLKIKVKK